MRNQMLCISPLLVSMQANALDFGGLKQQVGNLGKPASQEVAEQSGTPTCPCSTARIMNREAK